MTAETENQIYWEEINKCFADKLLMSFQPLQNFYAPFLSKLSRSSNCCTENISSSLIWDSNFDHAKVRFLSKIVYFDFVATLFIQNNFHGKLVQMNEYLIWNQPNKRNIE